MGLAVAKLIRKGGRGTFDGFAGIGRAAFTYGRAFKFIVVRLCRTERNLEWRLPAAACGCA